MIKKWSEEMRRELEEVLDIAIRWVAIRAYRVIRRHRPDLSDDRIESAVANAIAESTQAEAPN